jgi:hypothetical protein
MEAGGRLLPGIALHGHVVADLEQLLHIGRVERLRELRGEGRRNVSEVEVDSVARGGEVDPIEIADALRLDQRGDGAADDAEGVPLDLGPVRVEPRVAEDVEVPLALDAGFAQSRSKKSGFMSNEMAWSSVGA